MDHLESHQEPIRASGSSVGGQSFSTDASFSPSYSHNFNTNYDDEDAEEEQEEPQTQVTVDHENSFEDLEQFLSHLDCSSTDGSISDSDLPSDQSQQDIKALEMRTLKEHLKAIVKDLHIAIGEYSTVFFFFFLPVCIYIYGWYDNLAKVI